MYFHNHESKKAKVINNNVVNDELKYQDDKLFCSNMRHEMNKIQNKDQAIGLYRINKISCLLMIVTNIYSKIDIVVYYIFINVLVNHVKKNFVEYRQFI